MDEHKRIERCIASYIARNYKRAAEIGVGANTAAVRMLLSSGIAVFCTDIRNFPPVPGISVLNDDIFLPDRSLYRGVDLLYSIRPGEEMIPPMISLARELDCDLLVYHLGFEGYGDGGELIDCGVILHRYHHAQKPSKSVF